MIYISEKRLSSSEENPCDACDKLDLTFIARECVRKGTFRGAIYEHVDIRYLMHCYVQCLENYVPLLNHWEKYFFGREGDAVDITKTVKEVSLVS